MGYLSVIICTRDPHAGRLEQTLRALQHQSLPASEWETLVVDNGSSPPLNRAPLPVALKNLRVVVEPNPGLTAARLKGIREAQGEVLIFADDDNVLDPSFLSKVQAYFAQDPALAVAGGIIRPQYEQTPPDWAEEFAGLLALKDHGDTPLFADGNPQAAWPLFAPVGAGLCIRRASAHQYADDVAGSNQRRGLDRRGAELTSGGDNDMVFTALRNGGKVAYFPDLLLTHMIPPARLEPRYLERLNRGIQRSWVRVLAIHRACPWSAIPRWTVPLRKGRAWFTYRAWSSPAARIRWFGACGHFEGRADLS